MISSFIRAENVHLAYEVRASRSLSALFNKERAGRQTIQALNGVSFELKAGDRLGLVGPNGAGKTTLLKVLNGIYLPNSGRVAIKGRIDALFNINLGFRAELSGRRNIILRGLINGWTPEQIEAHIDSIIDFSELGKFIDLPYKAYSQGMAARLAFSIATVLEPEILLMDEWIGAGDASFQKKASDRMNELTQRARIMVLASHNVPLMSRTCNKIMILSRGCVQDFLTIDEWTAAGCPAGQ